MISASTETDIVMVAPQLRFCEALDAAKLVHLDMYLYLYARECLATRCEQSIYLIWHFAQPKVTDQSYRQALRHMIADVSGTLCVGSSGVNTEDSISTGAKVSGIA